VADLDLARRIVHRVDGMEDAVVRKGLVYTRDGSDELLMDVYAPSGRQPDTRTPAVVFVHGGPIPREMMAPREWGCFVSYGELVAASGLVGIVFNHRLHAPTDYGTAESDMKAAIDYVRSHADELGVDRDRLAVWVFSGGGPLAAWCLRERPAYLACLLAFYAILDVRHLLPANADPGLTARAQAFSPAAHLTDSGAALPMLVARAGLDAPMVNTSIDAFVREALASNAPLDLLNHREGQHGFDILNDDPRSREIISRAVAFATAHLVSSAAGV
jgi:acetyl esterase/lipase